LSSDIDFKTSMRFDYGVASGMGPGVVRVVANNPGPFTFKGTNTYLVGSQDLAVIDPGPDDPEHCAAILAAAAGRPLTHILITHTHRDHVDGLKRLQDMTGAKSCGYGRDPSAAQSQSISPSGSEFVECDFAPDLALRHGDRVAGEDWILEAIHTPGHAPDHICYKRADRSMVFSGDHVMAWNTTVVAPPEGRMADYMASLELLLDHPADVYLPGHGGRLEDPVRMVKAYLVHRKWREQAILGAIRDGIGSIRGIVRLIYRDLDHKLVTAASLSVLAHVEHLMERGLVAADAPVGFETELSPVR